jgi:hypothetical protein
MAVPVIDFTPSVGWLARVAAYRDEYDFPDEPDGSGGYHRRNGFFGAVDGEMLHGMLRILSPARLIEVGSGNSTRIAAPLVADHRSIDPQPRADLPASVHRIRSEVQAVPLDTFDVLGAGDVLFIDSDHRLIPGGAVEHLYLRVLPRIASGVIVHVHDIFLPADYPTRWARRQYTEQTVLAAFLEGNTDWRVMLAAHWLHLEYPHLLADAIPSYGPEVTPSSFWMVRL